MLERGGPAGSKADFSALLHGHPPQGRVPELRPLQERPVRGQARRLLPREEHALAAEDGVPGRAAAPRRPREDQPARRLSGLPSASEAGIAVAAPVGDRGIGAGTRSTSTPAAARAMASGARV